MDRYYKLDWVWDNGITYQIMVDGPNCPILHFSTSVRALNSTRLHEYRIDEWNSSGSAPVAVNCVGLNCVTDRYELQYSDASLLTRPGGQAGKFNSNFRFPIPTRSIPIYPPK